MFRSCVIAALLCLAWVPPSEAQLPLPGTTEANQEPESESKAEGIALNPAATDAEVAERLKAILDATRWIEGLQIEVNEGIVFLSGQAESPEVRDQAVAVAGNLEGVVTVVDHLEIQRPEGWDLTPVWADFREWAETALKHSPLILFALVLLAVSLFLGRGVARGSQKLLGSRMRSDLLRVVVSRILGILVFLLGLYFVFRILGLTRLAFTVVGGTGLFGLVLGFAFRDIAENFLASVLLSVHHPFKTGDQIEVAGYNGFVQQVNSRSTVLMTLDGNHVQIPNATIYKETIVNFSANPWLRLHFTVGIGYADSIARAQDVALAVMKKHEAVLEDPEPLVLVDSLGAATVNLHLYFWIDGSRHSRLKVTSAIIRQTKTAFQDAGISMPDEAREIVFPGGVPVQIIERPESSEEEKTTPAKTRPPGKPSSPLQATPPESEPASHIAEGHLESEAEDIQEQARHARLPESGSNLLKE